MAMGTQVNRDKFANEWQNAIEGYEQLPPSRVWEKIDLNLAYADAFRYKQKATFYKWAAIVAVLLTFSVSIPYTFIDFDKDSGNLAITNVDEPYHQQIPTINLTNLQTEPEISIITTGYEVNAGTPVTENVDEIQDSGNPSTALFSIERKEMEWDTSVETKEIWINPVPVYTQMMLNQKQSDHNKFWAGVGVGSSSFDPNYELNTANKVADALLSARPNFVNTGDVGGTLNSVSEDINEGVNYQVGINLGLRLADRWTLEGGMQYAEALLTTTTNVVIENRYFSKSLALVSESSNFDEVEQIAKTREIIEYVEDDVKMNNTFQFASFPVKAGFIIVDKRLNLRLNAGLITNFYLGNTLKDPTNSVATIEITPGDDSPYRTVSFSGLAGVTVGYRVMKNFDILFEPNYMRSLQDLTKSSTNFAAAPSGLGLSAGIRYNFK